MSAIGPVYPFSWPGGARVCMLPSVVFELWTEGTTPGANMPGGFISSNMKLKVRDLRVEKMIEFGGKVGMWRLLEVLDREQAPCSVLTTGRSVEVYQDVIREYHKRGHEITAHGWAEDVSSYEFDDPQEERENIRRTADAIERVTGQRPTGWLSPRATPSPNTLRLLVEEGFTWCGDFPDDELPYVVEIDGRPITILPYSGQAVNDYQVALIQGNSPGVYVEEFSKTLDFLYEEHQLTGRPGLIRASVHAHVYGRSWGRWAFRDTIRYARRFSDVWITTRAKLAEHVLRQYASQRAKGATTTGTRGRM